jgi:hypothetical protein
MALPRISAYPLATPDQQQRDQHQRRRPTASPHRLALAHNASVSTIWNKEVSYGYVYISIERFIRQD